MRTTYWDDIRQSLYNVVDHNLLENGAYFTVTTGQKNPAGNDVSRLYPVTDPSLYSVSGHIWQSAFHNFVYESGIVNSPPPIVASGVYINGVFTPKGSGVHIDYINGRVILNTAISTSSVVQAAFSFKEYSFVRPDNSKAFVNNTKFETNSKVNNVPFAASPNEIYLPAILIELDSATERGFQLGGTHETLPNFKLTLLSTNQTQIDGLASLICFQSTESFPIVSANSGPKFDFYNDLTQNYSFYEWVRLSQNLAFLKSVKYNRFYDAKSENIEPSLFGGIINAEISAIR